MPGALPAGQNAPQTPPRGLYTEQLSGTPFTAPRAENRRSWLYRIRPSAMHQPFRRIDDGLFRSAPCMRPAPPNRLRWDPLPYPERAGRFRRWAGDDRRATATRRARSASGCTSTARNRSMTDRVFYNADGELLIVPQHGRLLLAPSSASSTPRPARSP